MKDAALLHAIAAAEVDEEAPATGGALGIHRSRQHLDSHDAVFRGNKARRDGHLGVRCVGAARRNLGFEAVREQHDGCQGKKPAGHVQDGGARFSANLSMTAF